MVTRIPKYVLVGLELVVFNVPVNNCQSCGVAASMVIFGVKVILLPPRDPKTVDHPYKSVAAVKGPTGLYQNLIN